MATKMCPVCGKWFDIEFKKGRKKKYCSDKCCKKATNQVYTSKKNANRPTTKCCALCGTEFEIDYSAGKQREIYCSESCRAEGRRLYAKSCYHKKAEQDPKYWANEQRKCIICGEEFTPTNHSQLICKKDHKAICEVCGKEFILHRDKKNRLYITRTCSKKCASLLCNTTMQEKYGVRRAWENHEIQAKAVQASMSSRMKKPPDESYEK